MNILNFYNIYVFFIFYDFFSLGQGKGYGNKGGMTGTTITSPSSSSWESRRRSPPRSSFHELNDEVAFLECVRLPSTALLERVRVECGSSVAALGPAPAARHRQLPALSEQEIRRQSNKYKKDYAGLDARLDARQNRP